MPLSLGQKLGLQVSDSSWVHDRSCCQQLRPKKPKWKALPHTGSSQNSAGFPGSPRFLFLRLLSWQPHLEPRELADLPHPDPYLPRLCCFLWHRDLPFFLFRLCFSLWERGFLCRCLSPSPRRPPVKGSEDAYSVAWTEAQDPGVTF